MARESEREKEKQAPLHLQTPICLCYDALKYKSRIVQIILLGFSAVWPGPARPDLHLYLNLPFNQLNQCCGGLDGWWNMAFEEPQNVAIEQDP